MAFSLLVAGAGMSLGCVGGTTGREDLLPRDAAGDTSIDGQVADVSSDFEADASYTEDAGLDVVSDRISRLSGLDALFVSPDAPTRASDGGSDAPTGDGSISPTVDARASDGADEVGGPIGPQCPHGLKETGEECDDSGPCPACSPPTALAIQQYNPACFACALSKLKCRLLLKDFPCESLTATVDGGGQVPTVATAGPSKGELRSTLCLDLLKVMLSTKCAGGGDGVSGCYCGAAGDTCFTSGGSGLAKSQEEDALETRTPPDIDSRFTIKDLGGGRANAIVACLNDNNCTSCF